MLDLYFFGCLHEMGHRWHEPLKPGHVSLYYGQLPIESLFPAWEFDGKFAPHNANQRQGAARISRKHNWTILAWWDRTGDKRGNSNSAIVRRGTWTFAQMLQCLADSFPDVYARQTASLCLVEEA